MQSTSWRYFKFFESKPQTALLEDVELTTCCVSPVYIFMGAVDGRVYFIDRSAGSGAPAVQFKAYTGPVTHMMYLPARNVLATIGDDDALSSSILRLWSVDKCVSLHREALTPSLATSGGAALRPPCWQHLLFAPPHSALPPGARAVCPLLPPIQGSAAPTTASTTTSSNSVCSVVTSFDISEDMHYAAFGLVSGECIVLCGDLEKERSVKVCRMRSSVAHGGCLAAVVLPPSTHMCIEGKPGHRGAASPSTTALGGAFQYTSLLPGFKTGGQGPMQVLFTVYDDAITVWSVSDGAECTEYPTPFTFGASTHNVAWSANGQLMVCNASDRIAILQKQASATVLDPTCSDTYVYKEVSLDNTIPKCFTLSYRGYLTILSADERTPGLFSLQCYDTTHLIKGLSRPQEVHRNVAFLAADNADLLVVTRAYENKRVSYSLAKLSEVNIRAKLSTLFAKECFGIAKAMADKEEGIDPELHIHIQQRYGDFLYSKGKYAAAMDQYMNSIGHVEPSYVIRRYMQSQYMKELTRYLERLHETAHGQHAHTSHTSLLLNCYTKLKDDGKLLSFVQREDVGFDPLHAIEVCQQGGYHEAALHIAERYALPAPYTRTLVYDLHRADAALEYIQSLGVDDAESLLAEMGKHLIAREPIRTTSAIMQLCVHWNGPARRLPDTAGSGPRKPFQRSDAKLFLHVFVDAPVCLLNFLRGVAASGVLVEEDKQRDQQNAPLLLHTLFELYITQDLKHSARNADTSVSDVPIEQFPLEPLERRQEQALALLELFKDMYDANTLLVLCYEHRFSAGVHYLLKRLDLNADRVHHCRERLAAAKTIDEVKDATTQFMKLCVDRESSSSFVEGMGLWMTFLSQLLRHPCIQQCGDVLEEVLRHVEEREVLSPVTVLQMIAATTGESGGVQLGSVRGYCQRAMARQRDRTHHCRAEQAQNRDAIAELERKASSLADAPAVFANTHCARCEQTLDFPVAHFLCGHSLHRRCLDNTEECSLCAANSSHHRTVFETFSVSEFTSQMQSASRRGADGAMAVCTDAIRRGVMRAAVPLPSEAFLFGPDPLLKNADDKPQQQVYTAGGDVLLPEAIELW